MKDLKAIKQSWVSLPMFSFIYRMFRLPMTSWNADVCAESLHNIDEVPPNFFNVVQFTRVQYEGKHLCPNRSARFDEKCEQLRLKSVRLERIGYGVEGRREVWEAIGLMLVILFVDRRCLVWVLPFAPIDTKMYFNKWDIECRILAKQLNILS